VKQSSLINTNKNKAMCENKDIYKNQAYINKPCITTPFLTLTSIPVIVSFFIFTLIFFQPFFQTEYVYCADSLSEKTENNRVNITSDTLFANQEKFFAKFSGNVKVDYTDGSVLTADKVMIFFNNNDEKNSQQSIEKFEANGNVKYTYENKKAFTDKAVYTTKDQILVMTGENTRIESDGNSLTGEKIIMHRENGRIKVESGKNKRVSATFQSTNSKL